MRLHHAGFTLVELMVTVTVSVILIAIAAPSFGTLLLKRSAQVAADNLVSDLRFARSAAIKLSRTVSVCSATTSTVCSDGASSLTRLVCVSIQGRAALRAAGTESCT